MPRRLFLISAALSTLLLLLIAAVWIGEGAGILSGYDLFETRRPDGRVYRASLSRDGLNLYSVTPAAAPVDPPMPARIERVYTPFAGPRVEISPNPAYAAWESKFLRGLPASQQSFLGFVKVISPTVLITDVDDAHVQLDVTSTTALTLPYPWLLLPAGLLPFACLTRLPHHRRRAMRIKGGLCVRCGYDLRETPERCPECGLGGRGTRE